MRIATFNINGVNARLPALLAWLEREEPDIVCLQELKTPSATFPAAAINDAGYGAVWQGQKSWNGIAILAYGSEPVAIRYGLPDDPDPRQARYLEAAVEGIVIGCLYAPNGNPRPGPKFDYKMQWLGQLLDHARGLIDADVPAVLAGDYNIMPTDLDVYKPERWEGDALFNPEVRAVFTDLLAQGWIDAIRTLHPHDPIYTFWDYVRNAWGRNAGLRLDHLLLSPAIAGRLVNAGVDTYLRGNDKPSDHAPAWIEITE